MAGKTPARIDTAKRSIVSRRRGVLAARRVLRAEAVLEEFRREVLRLQLGEIGGDEFGESALGGAALDVAPRAVERRQLVVEPVELPIDELLDPLRHPAAVEALEDA